MKGGRESVQLRVATIVVIACSALAFSCGSPGREAGSDPGYATTLRVFELILSGISGPEDEIVVLVSDTQSPHDFQPRPSIVQRLTQSRSLFLGDPRLDGWAADLSETQVVYLSSFVRDSDLMYVNGEKDPHFWTDPDVVAGMLSELAAVLCRMQPDSCDVYRSREAAFASRLGELSEELETDLAPLRDRCVFSAQPFFQYFLRRFGIRDAGTLEPVPGQEPSAAHVVRLITRAKSENCIGILAQRRLPDASARLMRRETNLPIIYLDPVGNSDDDTYAAFLRRNADVLLSTAAPTP